MMAVFLANNEFNHYAAVGVLLLMAIGFGGVNLLLSTKLLGPKRDGQIKGTVYESGMNPVGSARRRFNVRFYIVAMTFLLFDVEIVFLYPWAITFPGLSAEVGSEGASLSPLFLGRMFFFVITTVIAFLYAFRKGVFRYD